ncbi:MAG: hypothetical protein ACR2P1_24155 [Pseudomonadales bacterium]
MTKTMQVTAKPYSLCSFDDSREPAAFVKAAALGMALCVAMCTSSTVDAGSREQAKRIHDRIAGVPPSDSVLADMQSDIHNTGDGQGIADGSPLGAAYTAMNNPAFYNVTLKNLVTPWTNGDFDAFAALNDYTATVIGMVRDDKDFRTILSANTIYVGNLNHPSMGGVPAYANTDNAHYENMEINGADLSDDTVLIETSQASVIGTPAEATAGVMTTRAAAKAFFIDGTNRAMFRFTLLNHLCNDMEQVKDTTRPSDRIRQDVSRSPGGDSRIFLNNCVGCHNGMDPMAQAFAYYDFVNTDDAGTDGFMQYIGGVVDPKYHINSANFQFGFVTPDDSWDNYWRSGPNAELLGWDPALPGGGNGAKSMGQELAHSEAFAQCQVKKVFRAVCLRDAGEPDRSSFENIVSGFKQSGYNLKRVFAETAVYCMGD